MKVHGFKRGALPALCVSLVALAVGATVALAQAPRSGSHQTAHRRALADQSRAAGSRWVATWGAGVQESTTDLAAFTRQPVNLSDQTIRNVVYAAVGGDVARVRLTNAFGTGPLTIGDAALGLEQNGASTVAGSDAPLTFGGSRAVTIPPGAQALSDPVHLRIPAGADLAVSVFVPDATSPATIHWDSQQTNYLASGDHADDTAGQAFTTTVTPWYLVDAVDVLASRDLDGAIVATGDSITAADGSTPNANTRWPNDLARRLNASHGPRLSVVDSAIGGNRVLNDSPCFGQNEVARFGRDVLSMSGIKEVILLEGVNDLGFSQVTDANNPGLPITCWGLRTDVSVNDMIEGYEQLIAQAHTAGVRIIGATIDPFKGSFYWSPAAEAKRDAINQWIKTSGAFDGVIDFATALGSPSDPDTLNPAYDSGDHLHPNDAGNQAMANAVSLGLLRAES